MVSKKVERIPEVDFFRGLAIVFMVIFHVAFNLYYFELASPNLWSGPWHWMARAAQFLFLGLVGVSIVLSSRGFVGQVRRALWIALLAGLISVGSSFVFGSDWVRFGVLHFIALAIPLVTLFKGKPVAALVLGAFILVYGRSFSDPFSGFLLSPYDYFAPLPWLSAPLFGLVLGELLYGEKKRSILPWANRARALLFLGRHSLVIYVLHHPVVMGSVYLLKMFL